MVKEGVASFKLFMAYPNVLMVDDEPIFQRHAEGREHKALFCMHAENGSVIDVIVAQMLAEGKTAPHLPRAHAPPRAEAEAVHRAIAMAEMAGAPVYIVHLSSEDALDERNHANRGVRAFAETCPQYLLLSIEDQCPARVSKAPSMSSRRRCARSSIKPRSGKDSSTITCRSSPPTIARSVSKTRRILGKDDFTKIPNGGPGIENRLQIMYHYGVNAGQLYAEPFRRADVHERPHGSSACIRRRASIAAGQRCRHRALGPERATTPSVPRPTTCASTTPCSKADRKGNAAKSFSRGEVMVDNKAASSSAKPAGAILKREATRRPRLISTSATRWIPERRIASRAPISRLIHALQRRPRAHRSQSPHLGHLQLRLALGRDVAASRPTCSRRPDRRRHELVAGDRHHPAGQPDRARSDAAQRARRAQSTAFRFRFSCALRSAVRGANMPAVLRALVACGWFGIQTWIGGQAIYSMLNMLWPQRTHMPGVLWICFFGFWLLNMVVIWRGMETIRFLQGYPRRSCW